MMQPRRVMWIAGLILWLAVLFLSGCQPQTEPGPAFYFGVDLSYVNEMDDCGAVYLENGQAQDPFQLFNDHGANLVRARLWHNPDWTDYSTQADVERTFARAQQAGMATLLDFHYSDNWADPGKQAIPVAWKDLAEDELPQAVYQYTYDVLTELDAKGLMPDFVQVGNETNSGMLKPVTELDWPRDAKLFNAGIRAVRDAAAETETSPKIILHVAQPENAGWWFREARENGITDFDVIGLSYYPQWSAFSVADVGAHTAYLRQEFGKQVMIVETAYPWTLDAVDETADNILNRGVRGYPITVEGQRQFMIDLTQSLISNGGFGGGIGNRPGFRRTVRPAGGKAPIGKMPPFSIFRTRSTRELIFSVTNICFPLIGWMACWMKNLMVSHCFRMMLVIIWIRYRI